MIKRIVDLYKKSFSGLSRDIWLLSLVTLVNRSGTMVIPFMMIYLTQELDFSLTHAGIVLMIAGLGSLLGSGLGGFLTDKLGHYRVQFWSLYLGGLMFMTLLFVESFWSICLAVFFLSIVADAFRPALMSSIAIYAKPENQTRSLSLIRLAINLGMAIGPAVGGLLAGTLGYHWLFLLDGLSCMLAGVVFWMLMEDKKAPPKTVKQETVEVDMGLVQSPYQDKLYMAFMVFLFLNAVVFMQLFYTVPVFYKEILTLTEFEIGLMMALNGGLIFIFEMPLVYIFERKYHKVSLISIGVIMVGLSFLVFNLPGPIILIAVLAMILISFGEIIVFPFSNSFVLDRSKAENRGKYMGLYAMTFSGASILAPGLGAYLVANIGFTLFWIILMIISVISMVGFLWIRPQLSSGIKGREEIDIKTAVA